jgi:prevent-host-death family protein
MHKININDAQTYLTDLIEKVIHGEEIIITKENKPLVRLVPILEAPPKPQFGSAKGLITMTEDFDEPLDDFKDYMQ